MRKLHFKYFMEILFDEPATNHRFSLKCVPQTNDIQKVEAVEVTIFPANDLSESVDAFGNYVIYGMIENPHEAFQVYVSADVTTGILEGEIEKAPWNVGKFRVQSAYTKPSEEMESYFASLDFNKVTGEEFNDREKAVYMMQRLYMDFHYKQGVTDIYTTAAEAFHKKEGVCQDYAHILISLCRMAHIPAKYVVGMLIGEGYSHAWVEIYYEGRWYGLDPTNDIVVKEEHIKISSGRDYNDCLVNQGIFTGGGCQTQKVSIIVEDK